MLGCLTSIHDQLKVIYCIIAFITCQAYTADSNEVLNKNRIFTAKNRKSSTLVRYDILHMGRISYPVTVEFDQSLNSDVIVVLFFTTCSQTFPSVCNNLL